MFWKITRKTIILTNLFIKLLVLEPIPLPHQSVSIHCGNDKQQQQTSTIIPLYFS